MEVKSIFNRHMMKSGGKTVRNRQEGRVGKLGLGGVMSELQGFVWNQWSKTIGYRG